MCICLCVDNLSKGKYFQSSKIQKYKKYKTIYYKAKSNCFFFFRFCILGSNVAQVFQPRKELMAQGIQEFSTILFFSV